jgi:hypothetical protein
MLKFTFRFIVGHNAGKFRKNLLIKELYYKTQNRSYPWIQLCGDILISKHPASEWWNSLPLQTKKLSLQRGFLVAPPTLPTVPLEEKASNEDIEMKSSSNNAAKASTTQSQPEKQQSQPNDTLSTQSQQQSAQSQQQSAQSQQESAQSQQESTQSQQESPSSKATSPNTSAIAGSKPPTVATIPTVPTAPTVPTVREKMQLPRRVPAGSTKINTSIRRNVNINTNTNNNSTKESPQSDRSRSRSKSESPWIDANNMNINIKKIIHLQVQVQYHNLNH